MTVIAVETPWTQLRASASRRLRRLAQVSFERFEEPSHDEVIDGIRQVIFRLGISAGRDGFGEYILGARSRLEQPILAGEPADVEVVTVNSYQHRLIACCVVLGWVDARWALNPLPRTWSPDLPDQPWPRDGDEVPEFPRPVGWPS